jgi:hypothetical protein
VPIAGVLRDILIKKKMTAAGELVLGREGDRAFNDTSVAQRAANRAGLEPITLHEARHTFASLMIAAGVNARALTAYMGHASVTTTYDRYGHLMPGMKTRRRRFSTLTLSARIRGRDWPPSIRSAAVGTRVFNVKRRRLTAKVWAESWCSRAPVVRQSADKIVDFHGLQRTGRVLSTRPANRMVEPKSGGGGI